MKKIKSRTKSRRSPGRPRLDQVAAIDDQLLTFALREFVEHGYGAASLNRLIAAAGLSKTTLYSRFSSKEKLFAAVMRQQIDRLAAASSLRSETGRADLVKGLRAYANRSLEVSLEPDFLAINRLIYSEAHRFSELGQVAADRTEAGIRQIARFISECAEVDGIPCKDPQGAAQAFILMLRGWFVNVMLTERVVPASEREAWVRRCVQILVGGRADW
jgi:AcrR family transcriptional regulator